MAKPHCTGTLKPLPWFTQPWSMKRVWRNEKVSKSYSLAHVGAECKAFWRHKESEATKLITESGGFPDGTSDKEPACQCRRCKRLRFNAWVGKILWRRAWLPTPVFLSGESHGQRSLVGYSLRGCKRVGHDWGNKASPPPSSGESFADPECFFFLAFFLCAASWIGPCLNIFKILVSHFIDDWVKNFKLKIMFLLN